MVRIDQSTLDMLNAGEKTKPKKNKYNAKQIAIDGYIFQSTKEGNRYQELKMQEHCGIVKNLELQPKFVLQEGFRHKGKWISPIRFTPDFRYKKDNEIIVEDVKGGKATKTEAYSIRKRLLLKQNPDIIFIET